jgi:hypothetical protein
MQSHSTLCAATLAMLTLSAGPGLVTSALAQAADPCAGLPPLGLFVEGQPADEFVAELRANPEDAEAFIRNAPPRGLGIAASPEALTESLQQFEQDARQLLDLPGALQGIGGLATLVLLQKLLPLDEAQPPVADKVVYGKIRDYVFLGEEAAWHLSVDVCFDEQGFVPLGEDRREFYHWDVEIAAGASSVTPRTDPSDPADPDAYGDPFPGLDFEFPAAAIDPADPGSLWRRGLDHKLGATGTGITVRNVYYRRLSEPDLTRLDDGHPFYTSTEASCVDLFTEGFPPATFGQLVDAGYCLGRCEHPAIFNTGG